MTSIPASYSVISQPSVLNQGGNAVALNGLLLSTNPRIPTGVVLSFPSGASVASYFGSVSAENVVAQGGLTLAGNPAGQGYFGGSVGATAVPGALLVAYYPQTAVAAFLRGGNAAAALTLAQLQALSGSLTVIMDGYPHVIASISFAASNSFSAAAAAIQAAFTDPTEASIHGLDRIKLHGTGTGTSLAVTAVTGILSVGDTITGTGIPALTTIIAQTAVQWRGGDLHHVSGHNGVQRVLHVVQHRS